MSNVIAFGEIMLRLATPDYLRFSQATEFDVTYGGSEANVAVSLANYGIDTSFVSSLPDNELGQAAISALKAQNVNTSHILKSGERIGIYFLETGAVGRGSKVLYDRADSSFAKLRRGLIDWDTIFKNATWFHWTGISPAVSESAADVCLEACEYAAKKGLTISTDLNYRTKLWKWGKSPNQVMAKLVEHCDVILASEEDADTMFGITTANVRNSSHDRATSFEQVARELMKKFPKAKKIVNTLRESKSASHNSWGGVLWNGEKLLQSPTYEITHIVDRVGGGDSFMGGLIYGLIAYPNDDKRALDFAVAASCLKHTIKGDFNRVTVDEVEKLMNGDGSGRVSR